MAFTIDVGSQAVWAPGVALLGVVVGFVAGMFGIGGGFLLTPLLVVIFKVPIEIAIGTGLCQIIGTAMSALLRHQNQKQGEVRIDLLMLPGSIVGVEAGTRTLAALARAGTVELPGGTVPLMTLVIDGLYVVLLVAVAALFWRQGTAAFEPLEHVRVGPLARARLPARIDLPAVPLRDVSAPLVAYIGLALGYLSGLLGIGGGIALMPILIYGFGFPIKIAAGTGILALFVTACIGTVSHALRGHVHLGLATTLLVGGALAAQFGAMATRRLPARTLRRVLAGVALATVLAIAWDLTRRVQ